jgi:hypothetical protein
LASRANKNGTGLLSDIKPLLGTHSPTSPQTVISSILAPKIGMALERFFSPTFDVLFSLSLEKYVIEEILMKTNNDGSSSSASLIQDLTNTIVKLVETAMDGEKKSHLSGR